MQFYYTHTPDTRVYQDGDYIESGTIEAVDMDTAIQVLIKQYELPVDETSVMPLTETDEFFDMKLIMQLQLLLLQTHKIEGGNHGILVSLDRSMGIV